MTFALGRREKLYALIETTYGTTPSLAAATNALRHINSSFTQTIDRVPREDKRNTRSLLQRIQRRKNVTWSCDGYLLPSGAAGTPPDGWDDLLEAVFGTETISAGTSVTYSLAKEFKKSLSLFRSNGQASGDAVMSYLVRGAVPQTVNFSLSGSDEARISISGFGADLLSAGKSLIDTDDGDDIVLKGANHAKMFSVGQYIDIVGGATGLEILAINEGTNTLTVDNHVAGSEDDVIIPSIVAVAETYVATASPISGVLGSFTMDSSSFDIISADITLDNGAAPHNDIYGTEKTTNFHLNNRSVTGSITFRVDDVNFLDLARTKDNFQRDLALVSGTTAGAIATFNLNTVNFDFTNANASGAEDVQVTVPFVALGSSGEDELELVLT